MPEYSAPEGPGSERKPIQPVWERDGEQSLSIFPAESSVRENQCRQRSKLKAASDDCVKEGGKNCVIGLAYCDQCAAVALGADYVIFS